MEEPLPAGGSCLLGSINLSEFVLNPFTHKSKFDYESFKNAVEAAVVALNEVLHDGLPLHPLEEQRTSVNGWRQIGLGIFGWHDCLLKLGIEYGSTNSCAYAECIGRAMIDKAIETSSNLTDVYGTYPNYNKEAILNSMFFKLNTSDETRKLVAEKGLANSQLLTIAPTGSTGTMLGVSTGIEPIFQFSYTRKTESLHGKDEYYKIYTPIVESFMKQNSIKDETDLPKYFNSAMTLDYKRRLEMQSVWQKYIDASISSTVNVPNDFTVEETEELYKLAYTLGLKGVTIYRSGCKREGILTTNKTTSNEEQTSNEDKVELVWGTTLESSDDLIGLKRKINTGCGSLHVQAYFDRADGQLMEVFLSKGGSGGCFGYMNALSRLISAALRTGLPFDYAIDQLQSVPNCPSYVKRSGTSKGGSCPSAIGYALIDMQKEILSDLICEDDEEDFEVIPDIQETHNPQIASTSTKATCPECKEEIYAIGGCVQCSSCGWSKCD